MTDRLDAALRDLADPRVIERERLRVETEAQLTPVERRSIARRVWDVLARILGLGS